MVVKDCQSFFGEFLLQRYNDYLVKTVHLSTMNKKNQRILEYTNFNISQL